MVGKYSPPDYVAKYRKRVEIVQKIGQLHFNLLFKTYFFISLQYVYNHFLLIWIFAILYHFLQSSSHVFSVLSTNALCDLSIF